MVEQDKRLSLRDKIKKYREKNKDFLFKQDNITANLNHLTVSRSYSETENVHFKYVIGKWGSFSLIYLIFFTLFYFFAYNFYGKPLLELDAFSFIIFFLFICTALNVCICLLAFFCALIVLFIGYFYIDYFSNEDDKELRTQKFEKFSYKLFHFCWTFCFWCITFYYVYWLAGKFFYRGGGSFGGGGASGRW